MKPILPAGRFFLPLLLIACSLLASCHNGKPTQADTEETAPSLIENDTEKFLYEKNGREITITGYSGIESSIRIPDEIGGLPVTAVAENAFHGFSYLEQVVIPDSVTVIDSAFVSCTDLKYAFIGKGVTSMNGAFRGCRSLETVAGGGSAVYMDEAFFGCSSLTKGVIPSSTQSALSAYADCTSLRTVEIRNGIPCLDGTFSGCRALTSVSIPESVLYLVSAFKNCSSLSEIRGGEKVTVYNGAFENCSHLKEITLGENTSELIGAFVGCSSLEEIHNQPVAVEKYAASFRGCRALREIIVPAVSDGSSLDAYSPADDFSACESATSVSLLAEFEVREDFCKAFSGLLSLKELTLPESRIPLYLRPAWEPSDAVYEGEDKGLAATLKKAKGASAVRITENYAVIGGRSFTHIYGYDTNVPDVEAILAEIDVSTFLPYRLTAYWCGYPTDGNRKEDTVTVERTYSFFLRTTGKNDGSLPESLKINGRDCAVGEP